MTDIYHTEAALAFLDSKAIHTDRGTFVRLEDAQAAAGGVKDRVVEEALRPKPRTMHEAKRMARQDPEIMEHFQPHVPVETRSVPAVEPKSPSRA